VFYLALGGLAAYAMIFGHTWKVRIQETPKSASMILYLVTGVLLLTRVFYYKNSNILGELYYTAMAICFILIILEQCFAREHVIAFGRFKLLSKMGKYTYGIYLTHPIALKITEIGFTQFGMVYGKDQIFLQFFVAISLTIVIAMSSYHLMEKRFLALKDRLLPAYTPSQRAS
jgi:peptidoglycan/LPS O-acetylase OafA/YrhL